MPSMDKALDRIRELQCPTGELESRVADILEDCNVSPGSQILVCREQRLDKNGADAYSINIADRIEPAITLFAKSGADDYVVRVEEVYFN